MHASGRANDSESLLFPPVPVFTKPESAAYAARRSCNPELPLFPPVPFSDSSENHLPVKFAGSNVWMPALYDPGSFASLLNVAVCERLNLKPEPSDMKVRGIGSRLQCCLGKIPGLCAYRW